LNRREAITRLAALGAGCVLAPRGLLAARAPLRVGVLGDPKASWYLGVQLGIEEAARTSELLGASVALEEDAVPGENGPPVFIAALADASWAPMEDAARAGGTLLLDARTTHPLSAPCSPLVFRVGVWRDPAARGAAPLLWHPSLVRYGAKQLNDRFGARFGKPMDGGAWAGWFAAKAAAEAALRTGSDDPVKLAAYLASADSALDGHKGRSLTFGADHRLRQPFYRLNDAQEAVEADWPEPTGAPTCAAGAAR
jgi:hypothetical protein